MDPTSEYGAAETNQDKCECRTKYISKKRGINTSPFTPLQFLAQTK